MSIDILDQSVKASTVCRFEIHYKQMHRFQSTVLFKEDNVYNNVYRCQNCGAPARPSAAAPTAVSSLSRLGGAEPLSGKCSNINILYRPAPAPAHVTAEQQIRGTLSPCGCRGLTLERGVVVICVDAVVLFVSPCVCVSLKLSI